MKMKALFATAALALSGFSANAQAAEKGDAYVGFGLNVWDVSARVSGLGSASWDPISLDGRIGYHFHKNWAVEGRLGFGVNDDSNVEVDRHLGVYLKGVLDMHDVFQPYMILGYSNIKMDIGGSSDSESDFSYGIGADLNFGQRWGMNLEWTRWYDDSEVGASVDVDAINIGLRYRF